MWTARDSVNDEMCVNQHLVTADYAVLYPENRFHTLLTEAGQRTQLLVSTHSEILALTLSMVLVTRTQKYPSHIPFAKQRRTSNPTQRWKRTTPAQRRVQLKQRSVCIHESHVANPTEAIPEAEGVQFRTTRGAACRRS